MTTETTSNAGGTQGGAAGGAAGAGAGTGGTAAGGTASGNAGGAGAGAAAFALKWADGGASKEFQDAYSAHAQKLGLSSEHAQGVVDFLAQRNAAAKAAQAKAIEAEAQAWKQALEKHPTLGGAKLEATMKHRDAGLKQFASEGLKKLLTDTGYIDHPEITALFARLGESNKEDTIAGGAGGGAGGAAKSEQERLQARYPTMFKK